MTDLVNGLFLGARELCVRVKGVFLEEEADLVARGEEVVIADVFGGWALAGGEAREGVVGEGEVVEEGARFVEEGGYG